jgi:hypothetical protein
MATVHDRHDNKAALATEEYYGLLHILVLDDAIVVKSPYDCTLC